ncbi:hypothetical protein ES288_D04G186500v1 [Gossypium darwinii]|uniref:Uncharacterized protein n=1 Tax=Gossypium darwinii TaxID=34276 RepID=A0A5D2CY99_GOSDA|nr:hypothetical protein ES288_D04G186500v1 [Gossypium darwinii]
MPCTFLSMTSAEGNDGRGAAVVVAWVRLRWQMSHDGLGEAAGVARLGGVRSAAAAAIRQVQKD